MTNNLVVDKVSFPLGLEGQVHDVIIFCNKLQTYSKQFVSSFKHLSNGLDVEKDDRGCIDILVWLEVNSLSGHVNKSINCD